jgi:hypothetical protein
MMAEAERADQQVSLEGGEGSSTRVPPELVPTATTDGHCGMIVDADVLNDVNEIPAFLSSLERVEDMLGERPEKALTDAGNNSGAVLEGLEQRGIDGYAPAESNQPKPGNPACREDPTQPMPEEIWPKLPRNGRKQLAESCFVYDAERDAYYRPSAGCFAVPRLRFGLVWADAKVRV